MTPEQRITRAFTGWITEAVIDPSKTADFEQLKQYLIGEMEEAVKLAANRTTLLWTNELPTTPGWYWCRSRIEGLNVCSVEWIGGELVAFIGGYDMSIALVDLQAEWAGPLEPPQ